jgi:hypothetical protein
MARGVSFGEQATAAEVTEKAHAEGKTDLLLR